ncbi:MAG: ABC transporter ATP-binding protein [Pyrinomonadaceae bacterium]|nr:ABC transporter ATP-binding protein [Sphingobacteriaceae bacterium]
MEHKNPLLKTTDLLVGYKQGSKSDKAVAGPLNLEMYKGQLICLLGPNGSGKSTLIRTLSGLHNPLKGTVELDGEFLSKLKPSQIARKLSLVLTDSVRSGNLDVYSLISLGRYPYSGWLGTLTSDDRKIINNAIESTHTEAFINRKMAQLSDGECQKVMLARALAQDTPLIILDEPTAHLDLPSRIELMRLLHQLARDTNKGILISTHELDLALQVADQIWLIKKDGTLESGTPENLILSGAFEAAFNKDGIQFDKSTGTFNFHQQTGREITLIGNGTVALWTKRALLRNGFMVVDKKTDLFVEILEGKNGPLWRVHNKNVTKDINSIDELINYIL